ncbi:hypothetical protein BDF20DRAFT_905907 [Mycotypha africana]|uniref:uncharacterized protein n=1 Tax=Mycotypha africana TaxID=64632 RepID=UPI0023014BD0|nr:uncharacterized protein BDF20DRAFT_905907 [Mycotypha africana]KAI8979050.1 hypothetical protein BDF20DRAFT_905907 [Mycotypha africana]
MEVIGQGFNLPLEDMSITNDNIDIYAKWLFEPQHRPAAVTQEGLEQEFYQIIFHQLSLLFQPRILHSANNAYAYNTPANSTASTASTAATQHSTSHNTKSAFHLNMLAAGAHSTLVPIPFNDTPSSRPTTTPQQQQKQQQQQHLSQLVQKHVELCKKTLKVFAMAGRTLKLSPKTWTDLLKVILGISDYLLKETRQEQQVGSGSDTAVDINMADELCDTLLQVLFELWLRSKTMDLEMWNILKTCFARWTHRSKTIQQWSSTSLALTKHIQFLLYGANEGTERVYLSGPNIKLELPKEFVHYAWYRVLYLLPHPLQLPHAHNFTLSMLAIGKLVETLLNNTQQQQKGTTNVHTTTAVSEDTYNQSRPNGNTILNMFGTYLFDATSKTSITIPTPLRTITSASPLSTTSITNSNNGQKKDDLQEFQRGCAESFATLCKIFCTPQQIEPFHRTYIERFYAAIRIGLQSDVCLPTILLSCTDLFAATNLEGVRMLVPDFIAAIKMILPKLRFDYKLTNGISIDQLRLAALKVLSTIMCMPNHFEKLKEKKGGLSIRDDYELCRNNLTENVSVASPMIGEQEQIITQLIRVLYASSASTEESDFTNSSLKFYILEVLLMSLRTETSSYNMRYILHLINVYVIEDVPFCPGLVGTVVKLIQEKILTMQLPADVTLVAFDVLMNFVDLYDFVKRDSKNVARELVLALSRYVDTLLYAGKLAQTYPLIVQAYDCMIKWILISQWIIDDSDCYNAVIATLSRGITIFDRNTAATSETVAEPNTAVNVEKKKKRETAFPPPKQLFQLPPRVGKSGHSHQHNNFQQPHMDPASTTSTGSNSTVRKKEEVAVRMAAEYCMSQLINHLGRFPLPLEQVILGKKTINNGSTARLAMMDDIEYLKQLAVNDNSNETTAISDMKFFLIDKRTILTIIDVTYSEHEKKNELGQVPSIIVIIRDTTGKYVWSMKARYKEDRGKLSEQVATPSSPSLIIESPKIMTPTMDKQLQSLPHVAPTVAAVNEKEMPTIKTLFAPETEAYEQWQSLKQLIQKQEELERKLPSTQHIDTTNVDQIRTVNDSNYRQQHQELNKGFRLFLAQIGYLLSENRYHITPLHLNDSLISEIERLDQLNESGDTTWEDLIKKPSPLSEQFLQFIHCLGWPIKTVEHKGFKGKLDASCCDTIPYYSDRTVEFMVNVPYFNKRKENLTLPDQFSQISSEDHVCIVWIEDMMHYKRLAKVIKNCTAKMMVYLFIHPLKKSAHRLYWIRIWIPSFTDANHANQLASQRLNENALVFGPLVDGIVVSRHALGSMVRSTAISAHQACRVVTDTYTRPYVIRKEYIEEVALRHRSEVPLST